MRYPEFPVVPSSSSTRNAIWTLLFCTLGLIPNCSKANERNKRAPQIKTPYETGESAEASKYTKPVCPKRAAFNPPLIGFSGNIEDPEELDDRTKEWVQRAGGRAIRMNPGNFEAMKCFVDGIVLRGGDDVPGLQFGEPSEPNIKPLEEGRYEFDMHLIELAEQVRLPIMGICLGSQELWVREGGTLVQDIPSEIKYPLNHRKVHRVTFTAGSFLSKLYPNGLEAWSDHHQSNDAVGAHSGKKPTDVFNIVGHSSDGVVEAMESKDMNKRFLLGIQWHPTGVSGVKLYRALVDHAKQRE